MQYHIRKFARTTRIIITAQVREESDEAHHISLGTKRLHLPGPESLNITLPIFMGSPGH